MQPRRRSSAQVATIIGFVLAFGVACSGASSGPGAVGPTPSGTPPPLPSPTPEPTSVPVANAPAPTPDPRQQAFGLHSPLPLAGEYAVTANLDDHTLTVVQIGAAAVATTVQLDLAPRAIGAAPNSDTVLATDGASTSHQLAVASLNASSESGTIEIGSAAEQLATPPPSGSSSAPVGVIESDDTIRSIDPSTHALGAPLKLGRGPHAVAVAAGNAMVTPQVFVANAGDATVSVLDQKLTAVQSTLGVGGTPVGIARTVDGRLWVADADAGSVSMFDVASGVKLQTIPIGPKLTALAATPDGHYLVLASSAPDAALYAVNLVSSLTAADKSSAVRHLGVPAGVLALATGAEITRAYATTGDGNLIYWDLESNTIDRTIAVGRNPVALTLGLVEPSGGVSVPQGAGTTGGGATTTGGSGTAPGGSTTGPGGATTSGTSSASSAPRGIGSTSGNPTVTGTPAAHG